MLLNSYVRNEAASFVMLEEKRLRKWSELLTQLYSVFYTVITTATEQTSFRRIIEKCLLSLEVLFTHMSLEKANRKTIFVSLLAHLEIFFV